MLLTGILVLAGCGSSGPGSDGVAHPSPAVSSGAGGAPGSPGAPPPTAVPSSLPPLPGSVPAPARERTEAGAAAFVEHYFLALNTAWMTPKAGLLPPLADSGCSACSVFEQTALMLQVDKQRYSGVPNTVQSVAAAAGKSPTDAAYPVVATVSQNGASVVDGTGKVVSTDRRAVVKFRFTLHHDGSAWRVQAIDLTS